MNARCISEDPKASFGFCDLNKLKIAKIFGLAGLLMFIYERKTEYIFSSCCINLLQCPLKKVIDFQHFRGFMVEGT